MLTRRVLLSSVAALALPKEAFAAGTPAAKDAYLYIIWPPDGAKIKGAFWCRFGLRNMGVTHAGDTAPNTGHHHLLVDIKLVLGDSLHVPFNPPLVSKKITITVT